MYFVLFETKTPQSLSAISTTYYTTLQTLLKIQPGFISETPYASPSTQKGLLIARFVDANAENQWRLQHDHLKIENDARRNIFEEYRLRVGRGISLDGKEEVEGQEGGNGRVTGKEGRCVVLYERLVTAGTVPPTKDVRELIDPAKASTFDAAGAFVDTVVYQGEKSIVWISGWKDEAAAAGFGKVLQRVEGNSVQLVRLERDYGKGDREEAPEGADAAQAGSVDE